MFSGGIGDRESGWFGLMGQKLFVAVDECDTDGLARLMQDNELSSHVNDLDGDGFGLLHHLAMGSGAYATNESRAAAVPLLDVLLAGGADLDLRNQMQETPLILAAMYGSVRVTEYLLKHGARADLCDWSGHTAMARTERCKGTADDKVGRVYSS